MRRNLLISGRNAADCVICLPRTQSQPIVSARPFLRKKGQGHNGLKFTLWLRCGSRCGFYPARSGTYTNPQRHNAKNRLPHMRACAGAHTRANVTLWRCGVVVSSLSFQSLERKEEKGACFHNVSRNAATTARCGLAQSAGKSPKSLKSLEMGVF